MGEDTARPPVEEVARKFAQRLRERFHVYKIMLFGSRARGDYLRESDYDFIIVSDDFKGMRFPERMALVHGYWEGKVAAEPLCYTVEEYERLRSQITIVREADREGVEL